MEQRENKERKNNVSFSILSHLFHISVSSILSLLSISPRSFPSLSLISLHVLDHLTLLAAHPAPSLFSFSLIPVLSLLVPTSASRHHFLSFLYTGISSVTHLSYSLFYPQFSWFSWSCLCPSCSAPHSSIFLLLSFFPLSVFHFLGLFTFLLTLSLYLFSPGPLLFFSPSSKNVSSVSPLSHPI
jgi:hypothetical protein